MISFIFISYLSLSVPKDHEILIKEIQTFLAPESYKVKKECQT
jgi:hypothetical protein